LEEGEECVSMKKNDPELTSYSEILLQEEQEEEDSDSCRIVDIDINDNFDFSKYVSEDGERNAKANVVNKSGTTFSVTNTFANGNNLFI